MPGRALGCMLEKAYLAVWARLVKAEKEKSRAIKKATVFSEYIQV